MALAAILALCISSKFAPPSDAFDFQERLKRFDVAWSNTADLSLKEKASVKVNDSHNSALKEDWENVARNLVIATTLLEGRKPVVEDGIMVRAETPITESGGTINLIASWSYRPDSAKDVQIASCGKRGILKPGETLKLEINPAEALPELRQNPEAGVLLPVGVGNTQRTVYVSFVRNATSRLKAVATSKKKSVADLGKLLTVPADLSKQAELPWIQVLFQAEGLELGYQDLADFDQIFSAEREHSVFRVAFPRQLRWKKDAEVNVVVGLPNQFGSEHTYFDLFGRGRTITHCHKRGWVFVGMRPGGKVSDAVAWLRESRGLKAKNVFVIGQGLEHGGILNAEPLVSACAVTSTSAVVYRVRGKEPEGFEYSPSNPYSVVTDSLAATFARFDKVVDASP